MINRIHSFIDQRRVVVLSASVGSGHNRAGEAIRLALQKIRPHWTVEFIDALELTNSTFRRAYGTRYFDLIARAPHLVGYLYDRLDRPIRRPRIDRLRMQFQLWNFARLIDRLIEGDWDLAVCTHFLPAEILARLRSIGDVNFPQAIVTTDFDAHRLWVNSPCEQYFTATEESRANLAGYGVPAERIFAAGIPIHPIFADWKSPAECRQVHGFAGDQPVVLQLSGGSGFGPVEEVHRRILESSIPLQLVAVAGRNAELRRRLEEIPCPRHHRRQIIGFTDRMNELMGAADIVVSKPGGLSTSESLACGAGMLLTDPIPGQEMRNSDYLLENGAAIKVNNLSSLSFKLAALLNEPRRLEAMRGNAKRLARPHAAFDVAEKCAAMIDQREDLPRSITIRRQRVGV